MTTLHDVRRVGLVTIGCALVAALALVVSTAPASAARSYECQHPLVTGEEAVHLHNISPRDACRLVRRLATWERHNRPCSAPTSCSAGG
jgi:hypothetical protein